MSSPNLCLSILAVDATSLFSDQVSSAKKLSVTPLVEKPRLSGCYATGKFLGLPLASLKA